MGIEISKKEYLDYIQEYIDRDVSLLQNFLKSLNKIKQQNWIPILDEINRGSNALVQNIKLKESSIVLKEATTNFFIDEETNEPIRVYKVTGKTSKKILERHEKEINKSMRAISNPLVG